MNMRIILQIAQLTKQITSMKELRQRNQDEAFAELGKDVYVKVFFEGREKVYSWQDGFIGYGEKPLAEWELDQMRTR